jgi:hypothetical protein
MRRSVISAVTRRAGVYVEGVIGGGVGRRASGRRRRAVRLRPDCAAGSHRPRMEPDTVIVHPVEPCSFRASR